MTQGRAPSSAAVTGPVAGADGISVFTEIIGAASGPDLHDRIHHLAHAHAVDYLRLPTADMARRRLRTRTQAGREIAIALPRDVQLFDGAVLELNDSAALVVRVETEHWLPLAARDQASALKLGYFCGNLHWRIRFEGEILLVAIETEERLYHDRLAPMIASGEVRLAAPAAGCA